jgi:serine/threonine protein kinase
MPVQEYADGRDLFTLLHKYGGKLSERLAVQLVLDPFLRVLHYLHTNNIIHRDIKVRVPLVEPWKNGSAWRHAIRTPASNS